MCEIVYLKFVKEKKNKEKKEIIKKIAKDIYSRNPDGIGILIERRSVIKDVSLENWIKKIDKVNLENVNEVIIHARLATSGLIDNENTQPITRGNIVVIHNGVFKHVDGEEDFRICTISEHEKVNTTAEKSDTIVFTEKLKNYYDKEKDFRKAIKILLRRVQGTASLFITNGEELYYYRHNKTFDFRYIRDLDLIVGATKIDKVLNVLKKKKKVLGFTFIEEFKEVGKRDIEDNILYEINGLIQEIDSIYIGEKVKKKKKKNYYAYWNNPLYIR